MYKGWRFCREARRTGVGFSQKQSSNFIKGFYPGGKVPFYDKARSWFFFNGVMVAVCRSFTENGIDKAGIERICSLCKSFWLKGLRGGPDKPDASIAFMLEWGMRKKRGRDRQFLKMMEHGVFSPQLEEMAEPLLKLDEKTSLALRKMFELLAPLLGGKHPKQADPIAVFDDLFECVDARSMRACFAKNGLLRIIRAFCRRLRHEALLMADRDAATAWSKAMQSLKCISDIHAGRHGNAGERDAQLEKQIRRVFSRVNDACARMHTTLLMRGGQWFFEPGDWRESVSADDLGGPMLSGVVGRFEILDNGCKIIDTGGGNRKKIYVLKRNVQTGRPSSRIVAVTIAYFLKAYIADRGAGGWVTPKNDVEKIPELKNWLQSFEHGDYERFRREQLEFDEETSPTGAKIRSGKWRIKRDAF